MANRYGDAAILAARQAASGGNPIAQWEKSLEKLYPTSPVARQKSGPRGAFLGLCEEGLVKEIPAGDYSSSKDSKAYAVRAVALLTAAKQHWSKSALWHEVTDGAGKQENGQIDIVLALWNNDLIVGKPKPENGASVSVAK
jgi:hypothetical protein